MCIIKYSILFGSKIINVFSLAEGKAASSEWDSQLVVIKFVFFGPAMFRSKYLRSQ